MIANVRRKIKRGAKLGLDFIQVTVSLHILAPLVSLRYPRKCLLVEPLVTSIPNDEGLLKRTFTILGKQVKFENEIDWEADFEGGSWPMLSASRYSSFFAKKMFSRFDKVNMRVYNFQAYDIAGVFEAFSAFLTSLVAKVLRRISRFYFKALSWVVGLDLYVFAVKR